MDEQKLASPHNDTTQHLKRINCQYMQQHGYNSKQLGWVNEISQNCAFYMMPYIQN